ncbi:putative Thiol-disulfide oxidoreductase ResA [Paratrimastix pyriformis]|uniref:Thiol-disulfide oxidoreductase ResA n=1 Tax=Paratrimastix pyriformis TaxID=342808 RepID=A0ABQ8UVF7_9EUKA|nr:putative Thiol-disulfide oxidoreductase ResA [Paratrimastix pyriformis]
MSLGDPAGPLDSLQWVKNGPQKLQKGRFTVVEFWATWCPPCRASIPHITNLAKKYPGITFVGVSNEDMGTVQSFLASMGSQADYAIALDSTQTVNAAYMRAFRQNGIPCAFLVGPDLTVRWVGHPMNLEEQIVQQLSETNGLVAQLQEMGFSDRKARHAINDAPGDLDAKISWLAEHSEDAALEATDPCPAPSVNCVGGAMGWGSPGQTTAEEHRIPAGSAGADNQESVRQRMAQLARERAARRQEGEALHKQMEAERAVGKRRLPLFWLSMILFYLLLIVAARFLKPLIQQQGRAP